MLLKYYFHYVIKSSNIILRDFFLISLENYNNYIKRSVKLHALFVSWKKIIKFPKIHQIMYGSIIRFYYRRKMKPQILNVFSTQTLEEYWQCRYFCRILFCHMRLSSFEGSLYPSYRCKGFSKQVMVSKSHEQS